MSQGKGQFIWYDVLTSDPPSAEFFYCDVIGWTAEDSDLADGYTVFLAGQERVAGLRSITEEAKAIGAPASWRGYIGVEDVDLDVECLKAAGGLVYHAPDDIQRVGRFAVCADPQGALFILFKGAGDAGPRPAPAGTPGRVGWHELHARDGAEAFAFYETLFGWKKLETFDMGAAGTYQIFSTGDGSAGGILPEIPQTQVPFWLYYFNVEGIEAALERVKTDGGQVLFGPAPVPGGNLIAHCLDPQGALFALVEPKKSPNPDRESG
ncbi:MAG: VOC family protein [Alphaproteobacteria bacterium]|nr:VOC family protein [Alphaproteobacteria bacterium]